MKHFCGRWMSICSAAFPVCLTAMLAIAVLLFAKKYSDCSEHFNSDDLTTIAFGDDLLGRGGEMAGWHIPFAPYLFPDLLIHLPVQALISDLALIFLGYALLFNAGLVAVVTW